MMRKHAAAVLRLVPAIMCWMMPGGILSRDDWRTSRRYALAIGWLSWAAWWEYLALRVEHGPPDDHDELRF